MDARDVVSTYWRTANARDWPAFGALCAEHIVYEVPQTRERVRGRAAYVEFNATWPGDWRADVIDLVADADKAVSVVAFVVGGRSETGISVFELAADGLIERITDWWPAAYEPPPRQTAVVERY